MKTRTMYAMFTFCCSKQNCLIQKVSKIITVICLDNPLKATITICYKSPKRKSNDFFKKGVSNKNYYHFKSRFSFEKDRKTELSKWALYYLTFVSNIKISVRD